MPTFEGFYFVFADNTQRQLVPQILYLEIAVLLANAGLLMLFLKERGERRYSADEVQSMAKRLQKHKR